MAITVKAKPPASASAVIAVEKRIGSRIPDGYRHFLLAMDGGRPVEGYLPATEVLLDWFLGIDDIEASLVGLKGRLRADLIPIAAVAGGNYICISVDEKRRGAIFFFDHEREDAQGGARKIADSFDDLVARLEIPPPAQLSEARVISVSIDPEFLRWAKEQEALEDAWPRLVWPPRSAQQP